MGFKLCQAPQRALLRVLRVDMTIKRALCEDPKLIGPWFELVRNTVAKYGILEEDFHNFDETGFMMGMISTTMVVTSSDRH